MNRQSRARLLSRRAGCAGGIEAGPAGERHCRGQQESQEEAGYKTRLNFFLFVADRLIPRT